MSLAQCRKIEDSPSISTINKKKFLFLDFYSYFCIGKKSLMYIQLYYAAEYQCIMIVSHDIAILGSSFQ